MDFHNIVAFGISVAVHIWFSHGDLSPQKRQAQELNKSCHCKMTMPPKCHFDIGGRVRCPDKWYYFKRSCYFYSVFRDPVTWDFAQASCFWDKAQLAEIGSAAEQTFLDNLIQMWSNDTSIMAWIGLHDRDNIGKHIWASTGKVANYTNWGTYEPNDNYKEHCVQITDTGLWGYTSCGLKRLYFCERPLESMCPLGWTFFRESCYIYETATFSWNEADVTCRAKESHIAEITSYPENAFVINLMKGAKLLEMHGYNVFTYAAWAIDGNGETFGTDREISTGKAANYKKGDQHCLRIELDGQFHDVLCGFLSDVICERPANEACEWGWSFFNRRCYKYTDTTTNWESAQIACSAYFATLAEISSATENAFLVNLRIVSTDKFVRDIPLDDAWIGLNVVNGTYILNSSGNTASYTNWENDQPDNDKNSENCVEMYVDGKWNDNTCKKNRTYFCEKSSIVIAN